MEESSEHLKVAVRVRPLLEIDKVQDSIIFLNEVASIQHNNIQVVDNSHILSSSYDRVFAGDTTQHEIFEFVRPSIEGVARGFNCTILAYGQTGSGKTFTMFGAEWESNNPAPQVYYQNRIPRPVKSLQKASHVKTGIIPNSILHIFNTTQGKPLTIFCSFLQIYNEKIYYVILTNT